MITIDTEGLFEKYHNLNKSNYSTLNCLKLKKKKTTNLLTKSFIEYSIINETTISYVVSDQFKRTLIMYDMIRNRVMKRILLNYASCFIKFDKGKIITITKERDSTISCPAGIDILSLYSGKLISHINFLLWEFPNTLTQLNEDILIAGGFNSWIHYINVNKIGSKKNDPKENVVIKKYQLSTVSTVTKILLLDDDILGCAVGNKVIICNIDNGSILHEFRAYNGNIKDFLEVDYKTIITTSYGFAEPMKLWAFRKGTCIRSFPSVIDTNLQNTKQNKLILYNDEIAIISNNDILQFIDLKDGKCIRKIDSQSNIQNSVLEENFRKGQEFLEQNSRKNDDLNDEHINIISERFKNYNRQVLTILENKSLIILEYDCNQHFLTFLNE